MSVFSIFSVFILICSFANNAKNWSNFFCCVSKRMLSHNKWHYNITWRLTNSTKKKMVSLFLFLLFLPLPSLLPSLFPSLFNSLSFWLSPIREKRRNRKDRFQMNPYNCSVLYLVFFGSINYNYNKSCSSIINIRRVRILYSTLFVCFVCRLVIQFINITRMFGALTKFRQNLYDFL